MVLCMCTTHVDHDNCGTGCLYCFSQPPNTSNSSVTGSYIEGRNLSKFDQDILKILCAVLRQTGPVTFSGKDIVELDVDQLVVEAIKNEDSFIASYGEVS